MLLIATQTIESKVEVGQLFECKDLFESVEWDKMEKRDKLSFGRFFAKTVRDGRLSQIKRIERKQNNHAQYIKTEV